MPLRFLPARLGAKARTAMRRSFRAMVASLAVCVALLAAPRSAPAQCTLWTDRGIQVPRPNAMPPSWTWEPRGLTLVYDSHRHVTVGIGGTAYRPNSSSQALFYLPVSEFNGTQWVSRFDGSTANTPTYRNIGGAAFDGHRNVTVVYGGWIGYLGNPQNGLFEFNGTTWMEPAPAGARPPSTIYCPMTFDPKRHRTIALVQKGGTSGSMFETWEWNGAIWGKGPDMGPTDVSAARMVFDIARDRAFAYSGNAARDREETWEYTPGATPAQGVWQKITIPGAPFFSFYGVSLVYDPFRHQVLRHAGHGTSLYSYHDLTYVWDWGQLKWNIVDSQPGLNDRAGAGVAFDTDRDRVVIYGGGRAYQESNGTGRFQTYTDTWEYRRDGPGFSTLPASVTVDGGQTALFLATVIGENNTLQWLRDGVPVPGASGPILAVPSASQAVAGQYVLRASNACGLIHSPPALLTVRPPANNSSQTPSVIYSALLNGTTLGATADGAAPCGTSNASPDVWHRFTVPYDGAMSIDTCGSDFDTVLSLHSTNLAQVIGCSDDTPPAGCGVRTSALSLAVTQGQQMLVRVSGYQGAAGNYTLNTRVVPFNNSCSNPTPVFAGTYVGNTAGATVDGSASCGTSFNTPDIWYRFRSDCSGTLELNTIGSNYDTVVSVRAGCNGAELACNDDVQSGTSWSFVSLTIQPGADYLIRVSGYNGATGSAVLNVFPPVIAEDSCSTAVPVALGETTYRTRCATTGSLALPPWCEDAAGAVPFYDVWYKYTAAAPGLLEVRLCNLTFNTALAVYGSCNANVYSAVHCAARENSCGDPPLAQIATLPGDQYLLRLGGYYGLNAGLAGTGTLELTLVPFETGACCLTVGGCALASAYECAGTFQGEGTLCTPNPCPSFAGACCLGAQCTLVEPLACDAAGGAFAGTSTACLQAPGNPVICCRANVNTAGGLTVQDIFDFLGHWFAAAPESDFNRDGETSIQDIFDFLAAWFTGC